MTVDESAPASPALHALRTDAISAPEVQRILYCHGFASHFDPDKDKPRGLATLAPVDGVTVDYTRMPTAVFDAFAAAMTAPRNTLIVGTSMGGFFAAWLGSALGLPFVAINPAITPAVTLQRHVGAGQTHFGAPFVLSQAVVDAYADLPFRLDGAGTIVLDRGDAVIDAQATRAAVGDRLPVIAFPGGSHRFDHLPDLLPIIAATHCSSKQVWQSSHR